MSPRACAASTSASGRRACRSSHPARTAARRRSPSCACPGKSASGISSIAVTPSVDEVVEPRLARRRTCPRARTCRRATRRSTASCHGRPRHAPSVHSNARGSTTTLAPCTSPGLKRDAGSGTAARRRCDSDSACRRAPAARGAARTSRRLRGIGSAARSPAPSSSSSTVRAPGAQSRSDAVRRELGAERHRVRRASLRMTRPAQQHERAAVAADIRRRLRTSSCAGIAVVAVACRCATCHGSSPLDRQAGTGSLRRAH